MKNLLVLFLVVLFAGACSETDPTDTSEPEKTSPYSGAFLIADTLAWNTCASPPVPLRAIETTTVKGSSITFAGVTGTWIDSTLHGEGVSAERTVPIDVGSGCYGYYTISFDITFFGTDSLYGTYHVDKRFSIECQTPECMFRYRFSGIRP